MAEKHEIKKMKPCDSVHESSKDDSELRAIVDWSSDMSEEDVHNALALTSEDRTFEEKMSEIIDIKAPDGSGQRILKAVFAQTGIEREPLVHLNKSTTFIKKTYRMLVKLLGGVIILGCTIMAFVLVIEGLWNWKYLGDPESLVTSKDQIGKRFREVGTLSNDYYRYAGKSIVNDIKKVTKTYIAALMLMDFPVNEYRIRFTGDSATADAATNKEFEYPTLSENYSNAREVYRTYDDVFSLLDRANTRVWSFDEVQPEVCNFIESESPWGEDYTVSRCKVDYLVRVYGVLSQYYFSIDEADKAVKHAISGLRLAEFLRTSGVLISMDASSLKTSYLLMVLDKNLEKVRSAEKSTREELGLVLKGQNLISAVRRTAAAESYFEAGSLIQLFGILRSDSNLSLIGARDNWTLSLVNNSTLKWIGRPLLVNDAGNYLIYKSKVLETLWQVTKDDRLIEEKIGKANDRTFAELRGLRNWKGSWPELLEDLKHYSSKYTTDRYEETDYRALIKDCLPTHRAAQKFLTKLDVMTP
jgi:hypothetical protein